MDDIRRPKPTRPRIAPPVHRRTDFNAAASGHLSGQRSSNGLGHKEPQKHRTVRIVLRFQMPKAVRSVVLKLRSTRLFSYLRRYAPSHRKRPVVARFGWAGLAALMLLTVFIGVFDLRRAEMQYQLSPEAEALIGPASPAHAESLKLDAKAGVYEYNKGYLPGGDVAGQSARPKFTASFNRLPEEGTTVTDPVNETSVTFKPDFGLKEPIQEQNRLLYPLREGNGVKVYSLKSSGFKEDIIFNTFQGDTLTFKYNLELAPGTEARMESDGSLSVYGVASTLLGSVSTDNSKDEELLKKARENGEKSNLLFRFPAPFIIESGKKKSDAKAWFSLKGNELTVHAAKLKGASYPLSIDPSVYVETAAKLMRGNNETNIDFDVDGELIQKGSTTGARFDEWTSTMALNNGRWNGGTAVAGGKIYQVGGMATGGTSMPTIAGQQISTQGSNSTNFTMNMPASRPAGDLYIAVIGHDGTTAVTPPAGGNWNEYSDVREHAAYWKIGEDKGGGNEQASYTWTAGTGEEWAGVIVRVTGFDSADPINGTPASDSSSSNGNPIAPSVTPDQDATLILRGAGIDNDDPTGSWQPSGHSQVAGQRSSAGSGSASFVLASMDTPPSAGSPSGTATFSGFNDTWGASTIAINPAPGATTVSANVNWAHFNTSSARTIESPNPGEGSCTGWCTDIAYGLPEGRAGFSLVAYNGFLYAMGGVDSGGTKESTVYVAKLGANGEPARWHPTDLNKENWVYWYPSTSLSSPRSYTAAVAYNNRMYLLGGLTTGDSTVSTVEYADINPTGTLGSWTSTGMTALPTARYGHTAQVYNDRMYLIGGNSTLSGAPLNTVHYIKINAGGTMSGGWQATSGFTTGRMTWGGSFTTIWGGYLYLSGGCSAVNASGYCTAINDTVQLASINADGSLASWGSILDITNQRIGYGLVAWRNALYRVGGCTAQSTSSGSCTAVLNDVDVGIINPDGDASTVNITEASGSGDCIGSDPFNCDVPPAGDSAGQGGHMLSAVAIMNGYLYVVGGCTSFGGTNECSQGDGMSGNVVYAAIASDGTLRRPSTCIGSYYGAWCVDSTNRVNGTSGVGAAGTAIFGGRIYIIGGLNGTSGGTNSVFSNSINADGSLAGAWDQQSLSAVGVTESVAYTYAYARANPTSAGTYPGNLYIFGGCGGLGAGVGCSNNDYETEVYKCNIETSGLLEEADANDCTTSGQLQLDQSTGQLAGLGIHSGTVYANYIYLIGGFSASVSDRDTVFYAKLDDNNNVVAASGTEWVLSASRMEVGRRRGASFGYNGYLYAVGGFDGGAIIDDIEFAKVDVSTGEIGEFATSTVTINQRWGLSVAVSNSYAYVVGGCNVGTSPSGCTSFEPSIQTFQIYNNESGAPAGYSAGANLFNNDRVGGGSAIYNGYLYVAGGCTGVSYCATMTNNVQYAALDANGNVGSWSDATASLPGNRAFGKLMVAGDSLYYVAGNDDTCSATGNARYDKYNGISGTAVSALYSDPDYPDNPDVTQTLSGSTLSSAVNIDDNFGGRLSAMLCVPTTGNYTFWVAGDDGVELRLSTDTSPDNVSAIASVPGWTNANEWTKYTEQQSSPVALEAGKQYYIEANYKEGGGGDHVEIGWTLPGGVQNRPMSNTYYSSPDEWEPAEAGTPQATVFYATPSSGNITSWGTATNGLPQARADFGAAVWNDRIYVTGGNNVSGAPQDTVYISPQLSSGGNIGSAWATSTAFDVARSGHTTIAYANNLYVLGGFDGANYMSDVQFTQINADGTVDPWAFTTSLPGPVRQGDGFAANGYMYLFGGRSSDTNCESSTLVAPISANTTIASGNNPTGVGEWYETNAKYGGNRQGLATAYSEGKAYLLGGSCGQPGSSSTAYGTYTFDADNDADESAWTFVSDNGTNGLNASGTTRAWSHETDDTPSGSVGPTSGQGGNPDGYVYTESTSPAAAGDTFHMTFNTALDASAYAWDIEFYWNQRGDDNLATVAVQTNESGAGWVTRATYAQSGPDVATGGTQVWNQESLDLTGVISSASTQVRLLVTLGSTGNIWHNDFGIDSITISGAPNSSLTGSNRVVQTALLSQPQVAKYSRMIDTDSDVFPTKWLLNGIDNSIGARWAMRYRSMNDTDGVTTNDCGTTDMTTWGQETKFGNVTLGQPENYIPLDGSGIDIDCARFFYLAVTIDSSQSYGYPDDVSRGPTMTDLSLFFTADPSKRLRHGKTFTGGEQQPLDTPF